MKCLKVCRCSISPNTISLFGEYAKTSVNHFMKFLILNFLMRYCILVLTYYYSLIDNIMENQIHFITTKPLEIL